MQTDQEAYNVHSAQAVVSTRDDSEIAVAVGILKENCISDIATVIS